MKTIIIFILILSAEVFAHSFGHQFHEEDGQREKIFSSKQTFPLVGAKIKGVTKNTIFITIDDGPTRKVTSAVLDALSEYDAVATFFVIGKKVARNRATMERMVQLGHAVGNHTYNHEMDFPSKSTFYNSLMDAHEVVTPYLANNDITLFRAPGGVWNSWRTDVANDHPILSGYVGPIFWNAGGGVRGVKNDADWKCWKYKQSVKSCANSYVKQIYNNYRRGTASLVLFHDLKIKSAQLIKEVLRQLEGSSIKWQFKLVEEIPAVRDFK